MPGLPRNAREITNIIHKKHPEFRIIIDITNIYSWFEK